jgi:hypothetical protein
MGDPPSSGEGLKELWGMVGAGIGDNDNVSKAQHPLPADPFHQKRPFILDRTDHRVPHAIPLWTCG